MPNDGEESWGNGTRKKGGGGEYRVGKEDIGTHTRLVNQLSSPPATLLMTIVSPAAQLRERTVRPYTAPRTRTTR